MANGDWHQQPHVQPANQQPLLPQVRVSAQIVGWDGTSVWSTNRTDARVHIFPGVEFAQCASCHTMLQVGTARVHRCADCGAVACSDCLLTCDECRATVCGSHLALPFLEREGGLEVETVSCARCAAARLDALAEAEWAAAS